MNLFSNILNTSVKDRFLSWFTPTQDSNVFTWKTTSEKIASWEIKSRQLSPSENPFTQKKQWAISDFLTNFDPNKNILTPIETWVRNISQNIQQWGQELSDISMQHAQNVQNKGYRDEAKIKSTVAELLKQGFDQNTINTVIKNLDDQGKFQWSLAQNPISWTLASVESGLSKWLGTMFQGISNIWSAPLQETWTAWVTRFAKWAMETGLWSAQLATSIIPTTLWAKALVAPAVNTIFSTDTAWKVLQPISQWIETGIWMWQKALWFNPESSVSKDIQNIGSTAGTIALLGWAQKWAGKLYEWAKPIVSKAGKKISNIPNPVTGAKNVITREIPVGIMERDLSLTPTERANIETINGKPAGAVALEYNLPKDKQAMADTLSVKADEAYNGITSDLKNITTRSESAPAKEMLGIMLDEMGNSPILVRTMKPYMEKLKSMMEQSDYSLSEKNAIRRDFDRIVANKIFDSKWRVSGIEDKAIANIREGLSSELQNEAMQYGVDIKWKNDILRTSISLRDWVLRRLSQENKNNKIGLQDIWVGAILWAGDPLTTASIIFGKKALEKSAPWIAQRLYNSNKTPYATSNLKRGVTITPRDTTNGLSIAPDNVPTVRIPVKTPVKKPIVKPNTIKNESKVSKPTTGNTIPEGYFKNAFWEIQKNPSNKKWGFIKIPEIGKKAVKNPLVEEARKYKSAEEFVKSKWKPVYHWTPNKFEEFDINRAWESTDTWMFWKWIYFSDTFNEAKTYSKRWNKVWEVKEVYLNMKNPLVIKNKSDIPKIDVPMNTLEEMKMADTNYSKAFTKYLKDNWYDWVIDHLWPYKQYVVYDTNVITTKDKLKNIWKTANK